MNGLILSEREIRHNLNLDVNKNSKDFNYVRENMLSHFIVYSLELGNFISQGISDL